MILRPQTAQEKPSSTVSWYASLEVSRTAESGAFGARRGVLVP